MVIKIKSTAMNKVCTEHEWVGYLSTGTGSLTKAGICCVKCGLISGVAVKGEGEHFDWDSQPMETKDVICPQQKIMTKEDWNDIANGRDNDDFHISENLNLINKQIEDEFVEWLDSIIDNPFCIFNSPEDEVQVRLLKQVKEKYLFLINRNN